MTASNSSTSGFLHSIEKLLGRENFSTWKFAVQTYLEHEDLWICVEGTDDEWIGTLLLAGLSDEYKPMIMGLESSGIKITGDGVKAKILQDVKIVNKSSSSSALYCVNCMESKSNPNIRGRGPRCFECNSYGHISTNYPKKKNVSTSKPTNISSGSDSSTGCVPKHIASNYATGFCVRVSPCGQINDSWTSTQVNDYGCLLDKSQCGMASVKKQHNVVYLNDVFNLSSDEEDSVKVNSVGDNDQILDNSSDVNNLNSQSEIFNEFDDQHDSVSSIVDFF